MRNFVALLLQAIALCSQPADTSGVRVRTHGKEVPTNSTLETSVYASTCLIGSGKSLLQMLDVSLSGQRGVEGSLFC